MTIYIPRRDYIQKHGKLYGPIISIINSCNATVETESGFVHNFNRSMKYLILVEYLLTSLNIAAVSIQMILFNSTRASATFFLSYLFSQIFILGWSANEIKMQSLAISDAIYDSPWYYQNGNAKKAVLLIIMRAQRPLQLTIGPFDAMSTETAVTVVKGSYSYVTLMWTKYV
ncbi:odorant receptor Or2-like isoform X2 [Cylas formicarius]|uniref:odorant receptor Or2-like isoform X2 n=1 Tax=Cylas formicarius TaxID=197179 RepID=UPI002958AD01|nr:odorant receptor Or2-like isoform X2 [Cylas formicarius]